ncbi:MFS transporter [Fulvivirga sp. M361]|uniref:MFS transporter n=1 Tax=Fulvivirga sp. M361 TaxID=2594266 RepID=UPI001179AA26|nr:MFS transporter [Fulvivirga sp. M361]TRX58222.1 MFS transporter [Fulvivirga sp. M361]
MTGASKSWVLLIIVISQFACTSLWFAGNAVVNNIIDAYALQPDVVGYITSSVQFGFITGTLLFALFTLADRFSPSKVFFTCAVLGALANLIIFLGSALSILLISRFATGLLLAGIYPVGMKIAADHHKQGLGKALGYLVGALVVGTAFPHLLSSFDHILSWQYVVVATSLCSLSGGILMVLFVPDGPYRKRSTKLDLSSFFKVFKRKEFRLSAFGYFGHMWELYAFWAFIPGLLEAYASYNSITLNVSLLSFWMIAIGGISCVAGGYLSTRIGSHKTAFYALLISGCCCILSPFFFEVGLLPFIGLMSIWTLSVIADSPQFSTLVAQSAPEDAKGTALTIVNSIGFLITIISIQLLNWMVTEWEIKYIFTVLALGPIFGLLSITRNKSKS